MAEIRREQVAGMNIHYLNYSLEYFLNAQVETGFHTVELWCGVPHVWIDHYNFYDADKIKGKIREKGLEIACVTPENCIYPCQVGAWTKEWRERSYQYFVNGIRFTAELGCERMEINSGWGLHRETKQEAWNRSCDMLGKLADKAKEYGVTLVMETLRKEESQIVNTIQDLKKMLNQIDNSSIKPMIDTCAMISAGETLQQWFDEFPEQIAHMHFVDCDPFGHLIWGDGIQHLGDWIDILNRNHYEGYLGQEITDNRYYADPKTADFRNMKNFERYIG